MSVTNFDATSPDEFISVSDLETAGEASEATRESVKEGTITAAAIYETGPVCEAGDRAPPTDDGKTSEENVFEESPMNL